MDIDSDDDSEHEAEMKTRRAGQGGDGDGDGDGTSMKSSTSSRCLSYERITLPLASLLDPAFLRRHVLCAGAEVYMISCHTPSDQSNVVAIIPSGT